VQWDIFRTVWMHGDAKGLTIVGDPKQAIYGFRGADVTTYVAARDELLRNGATEVHLDINRRSTTPLVDAINAILQGPPLGPLMDKTITYDHPVKASGDVTCESARPPLTVFQLDGANRDPNREALARAIATEIERLRDAPLAWQSRGKAPPFTLGHCMVLTRTGKESVQIAGALRARGLACALVESDKLFETREAAELAALLESIAAPRDRSARMRALRTRFFDVAWTDLMRVVDAPDHHPLIARLFDWAALAVRRDYEQLFRRIVEDSHFAERALVLGGGERALVNTWHLIELLLEEVARSRCDLHELTLRLRRWMNEHEEVADDRDVQRAETDADAIRILTIHKAKGRPSLQSRRPSRRRGPHAPRRHARRTDQSAPRARSRRRKPTPRLRRAHTRTDPPLPPALRLARARRPRDLPPHPALHDPPPQDQPPAPRNHPRRSRRGA
jgi:exodeoxyribonuclease V beta subunit